VASSVIAAKTDDFDNVSHPSDLTQYCKTQPIIFTESQSYLLQCAVSGKSLQYSRHRPYLWQI